MLPIETGLPLPQVNRLRLRKLGPPCPPTAWRLAKLSVCGAFVCPLTSRTAAYWAAKTLGVRVTTAKTRAGLRVERTA